MSSAVAKKGSFSEGDGDLIPVEPDPLAKWPVCVFALADSTHYKAIEKDFHEFGIRPLFVESEEGIVEFHLRPEVFAVFVDLIKFPGALKIFRARDPEGAKSFWIALTQRLTNHQNHALYNVGVAEVLTLPVHPVTYKSRARLFLTRFLKAFSMPDDVTLPAGMFRPNSDQRMTYGNGENQSAPNRIHDLTPDEAAQWNNHQSGRDPSAPDWNNHQSGRDSSAPDWNQHVSKAPKKSLWRSKKSDLKTSPLYTGSFGTLQVPVERLRFHESVSAKLGQQMQLFEPVQSVEERHSYLNEAAVLESSAFIWTQNQKWKGRCQLLGQDPQSKELQFAYPKGMNQKSFPLRLAQTASNRLFVSIYLNRARLFFTQEFQSLRYDDNSFRVHVPELFFQVQRRGYFRLPLKGRSEIRAQLSLKPGAPKEYALEDIGAGGLCLLVNKEEVSNFQVKQICSEIVLNIQSRKIKCKGTIQWIAAESSQSDTWKVGVAFNDIDPDDQDGLTLFVMEESYKYLNQFVKD